MGQVFTIPPDIAFLPALANGLLARGDALQHTTVLVPTRRAARALVDELLAQSDTDALLLPVIRPLGDVDDDMPLGGSGDAPLTLPPAIPPMHRTLALARIIMLRARKTGIGPQSPAQAIALADELAALLDAFATEEVSLDALPDVVHKDFAEHWEETLDFLEVVTATWPEMLKSLGFIEPAQRRRHLIDAACARWEATPPGAVIAAGSTGSIPATARMLALIARMDDGAVVLPGLDKALDDAAWLACGPAHPQYGMRQLLGRMKVAREQVKDWPHVPGTLHAPAAARTKLASEALRPAETTDKWRDAGDTLLPLIDDALTGLTMVSADNPQLESLSIALALREVLDTPGKTAALVTPDRALARRVAGDLARWGIDIDDSGGTPLAHTVPGAFLLLVAQMLADQLAPVPLLAALKHPLAQGELASGHFHSAVELLDRRILRGPRPAPGLAGIDAAIADAKAADYGALSDTEHGRATRLVVRLTNLIGPAADIMAGGETDMSNLISAHLAAAEALAATEDMPGSEHLWADDAGDAAATFMAEVMEHAALMGDVAPQDYPAILHSLMAGRMVRPVRRSHARLQILGPLEARLQHVDRLILGGLNEGVWPARAETGAWLNRPMRAQLGLEAPERQIGLAAHDVAQGLGAPDVILTRADRADGQPTVPSRWWLRLENLVGGVADGDDRKTIPHGDWLEMARALDRPVREAAQINRPEPRPPVAARPARLSVTGINDLFRDPYAIYARHVLKLNVLDDLDASAAARERGDMIHKILERFSVEHPGPMPTEAYAKLMAIAGDEFDKADSRPAVRAIWYPRFVAAAEWFLEWEAARRGAIATTFVELKGEHAIDLQGRQFTLSGIADRIDVLKDGTLSILDYKTGAVPTAKQTTAKFSVQLPLEAAMAQAGAFHMEGKGPAAAATSELAYVDLKNGAVVDAIENGKDIMEEAMGSLDHTVSLLTKFEDDTTAYVSRPRPQFLSYDGDYDHLARVKEWQTTTDSE